MSWGSLNSKSKTAIVQGFDVERGVSITELMIAISLLVILALQGLHSYRRAVQQAQVDTAIETLRSIWLAQKTYRLQNDVYAEDLDTLAKAKLIDGALSRDSVRGFQYQTVVFSKSEEFVVKADGVEERGLSGSVTIDQDGVVSGSVYDNSGRALDIGE